VLRWGCNQFVEGYRCGSIASRLLGRLCRTITATVKESSGFIFTFLFALVIIFLALAAQFESFRDPLIILVSVPMSIAGALIFIALGIGGATLNIYTEVGLVTLMGLISKHGILIVEFANIKQKEGMSKRDAIEHAAGIRLRPILMTTAAMVLGVLPLIFCNRCGGCLTLQHRTGNSYRHSHWHIIYAIRSACGISPDWTEPFQVSVEYPVTVSDI